MDERAAKNHEGIPENAVDFMRALGNRERILEDSRIAVVVAHPDDESIAFGAQLPKFPGSSVIHITDGAPQNPELWNGFATREAYAQARQHEAHEALKLAGHTGIHESLLVSDQEAAFHLEETAQKLAKIFEARDIRFVLTHSYEGGHPDHDATAFAVHAAKKILEKKGRTIEIIEAPLYRPEESNGPSIHRQNFVPHPNKLIFIYDLEDEEQVLKKKMYAAHASQGETFTTMSTVTERLREAPDYDFTALPNNGKIGRIFSAAGLTEEKWLSLTTAALKKLELEEAG